MMRWTKSLAVCLILTSVAGTAWSQDAADPVDGYYAERYDENRWIRVAPTNQREMRTIVSISRAILSERVGVGGRPLDVVVTPEAFEVIEGMGLDFEIVVEDMQVAIDAERAEIERRRALRDITWYENYHPLAEIYDYIDALVADHPNLVTQEVIGQSIEGRDIVALRFTGPGNDGTRPQVVYNGCQHAREWVSPATVLFVTEHLLTNYGTDQRVTDVMDRVEFVVMPMVNPDGYNYSWTNNRLWRKNRRNNGNGTFGVDLNRNWSFQWGGSGSSGNTNSETYRGPSPFSEPETTAVGNLMESLPRKAAHIDFHSFSQLILYPWGYTFGDVSEPDRTTFVNLADDLSDAIFDVHGEFYVPQPASDLYIADGIMSDWSYSEGYWGLTFELRPDENDSDQFELPPDEIIPTGQENVPAVLTLAEFVAFPLRFEFPNGEPMIVEAGQTTPVTVTVTAPTGDVNSTSVTLHTRVGDSGAFDAAVMTFVGQNTYTADLPAANCNRQVQYYVSAATTDGETDSYPRGGANDPLSATSLEIISVTFDDAETNTGWTVGASGDGATTGVWNRMDPEATDAQPEDDHTPGGTDCWITDGNAGGSLGANDIDGGITTLTSPSFDATGGIDSPIAVLSYWRWYSNDQGGNPNADSMPVEVSFDGGSTWTEIEDVSQNANAWVYREFVLNDYGTPTSDTLVRFRASDLGGGSIVEAGVDDVALAIYGCSGSAGDYNGDGVVNTLDVLDFLNDWSNGDPNADFNGDGNVDTLDFLAFLNVWVEG